MIVSSLKRVFILKVVIALYPVRLRPGGGHHGEGGQRLEALPGLGAGAGLVAAAGPPGCGAGVRAARAVGAGPGFRV